MRALSFCSRDARRRDARPDEVRQQPVAWVGPRDVEPHRVVRGEEPVARLLLDDVARMLAGLGRDADQLAAERLLGERLVGGVDRLADRRAARRPRSRSTWPASPGRGRRSTRRRGCPGSSRCRACTSRRARRSACPGPGCTASAGTAPGSCLSCLSAAVMNAFQICAGRVPPATGLPPNSVSIGLQLVGVADPDGDGELRRVADEPRIAVVVGGARLAGRRAGRRARRACRCPA